MKLICKKLLIRQFTSFSIGECYTANVWVEGILIEGNNGCDFYFTTNKDYPYYIWDYFYTTKEIRKLKLQKLLGI